MNTHIAKVFRYELHRNFWRRGFLFTTFGLPLFAFVLYFGYNFISNLNRDDQPASESASTGNTGSSGLGNSLGSVQEMFATVGRVGYVDLSGQFQNPGSLQNFVLRYADEPAALAALNAGEISLFYVIAADYESTANVTLVMPRLNLAQASADPIRRLILNNLAQGVDRNVFNRLLTPANIKEINLQRDSSGQTTSDFGSDFAVIYIFALVLMLSVFTTNGYLMQTVIEEKETRLIEILISALRPTHLLTGKILALGVLGLIQIVTWLVAIVLLGRLAAGNTLQTLSALANLSLEPSQILIFLLYFLFGYLFFAAAYGMVGAVSSSMQEGPQFAVIFTLPAAIPLYFLGVFISTPDGVLPTFLSFFPLTSPLSMVMRVSVTAVPAWQIILSLVLLALADFAMIWLAGRLFRVQTLLAGQTPRFKDLPRLLRG